MKTKYLTIPVQLIEENEQTLTVLPIDKISSCPQCAAGQGCGQNPWFRGLIRPHPLTLPRPAHFQQSQPFFELTLPINILNLLILFIYGLPVIIFLTTLLITQTFLPPWAEFLIAISITSFSIIICKPVTQKYLQHHLTVSLDPRFSPKKVQRFLKRV